MSVEINAVSGRRAAPATRGLPALQEVHLQLSDGTTLDFTAPASGQEGKLDLVEGILPMSFARVGAPWTSVCPICLSECPRTKEHLPQGGRGGIEMHTQRRDRLTVRALPTLHTFNCMAVQR